MTCKEDVLECFYDILSDLQIKYVDLFLVSIIVYKAYFKGYFRYMFLLL